MRRLTQLIRLIYIQYILARYSVDRLIFTAPWLAPFAFLTYLNPWNWRLHKHRSRGRNLCLALEALGPIYIKFGQALSTRRDFIPDDIALELARLQDQVMPFAGEEAIAIITNELGHSITELFLDFNPRALASASIAQVHAATLHNGHSVVVKVLRPNIEKIIRRDLGLIYTLARLLERFWAGAKRLHPIEVVAEFERTILNELDLMREAANASQLRRNFKHSKELYIPEVYWDHCSTKVMVIERISGIPISDIAALKNANINLKRLATRGVEIFFTQVFRDCFFHADMHPGNIFVNPAHPNDPQYIAIDFGIIGTLSSSDQRYLAENILAFFKRDYRRVAELHVESGWVPAHIRVVDFEAAIRAVSEPIFERPLKDISAGQVLLRLFQTARAFEMEVQPQLLLLQKTLLTIEGLGRTIDPELDLWTTGKPFMEKWLRQQIGPRALLRQIKERAPYWTEKLPELPDLIYKALSTRQNPDHSAQNSAMVAELQLQLQHKQKQHRFLGISSIAFLGAAVSLVLPTLHHAAWLSSGFAAVGIIGLVAAVF